MLFCNMLQENSEGASAVARSSATICSDSDSDLPVISVTNTPVSIMCIDCCYVYCMTTYIKMMQVDVVSQHPQILS